MMCFTGSRKHVLCDQAKRHTHVLGLGLCEAGTRVWGLGEEASGCHTALSLPPAPTVSQVRKPVHKPP